MVKFFRWSRKHPGQSTAIGWGLVAIFRHFFYMHNVIGQVTRAADLSFFALLFVWAFVMRWRSKHKPDYLQPIVDRQVAEVARHNTLVIGSEGDASMAELDATSSPAA